MRIQLSLGLTDKADLDIRLENKRKIDVYTIKDRPLLLAKLSCSETKWMAYPTSSQEKARAVKYS